MAAAMKRVSDSEADVPVKISSQTVSDAKLESFIQWCNKHKFNISPKVCIERERSCAQHGMIAREDISSGEVLFSIPRPLLLSPQTSSISELLHQGQQEMGGDNGWVLLLLALLYEYNNPQSSWRPYLDLVADFSQLDLPMFWSSAEREELLQGTGVESAVSRDLTLMEKDFKTKALPFMQKHSEVFSAACQRFELYKQMVAFVMAYSFTEPDEKVRGTNGNAEGEEASDSDTEDAGSSPPPMMVPLADILNHVAKNNAALTFHTEALRMVSTKDIKKGEEVFNTYGELANKDLLHMYGFAEQYPDNHYDTVDIAVSVVTAAAEESEGGDPELMAAKLLFLQEQDLHQAGESYVLGVEGVLTDDELQAVLKVLVMSADEFKEYAEQEGWSDAENDDDDDNSSALSFAKIPDLAQSWKKILSRCAEMCLEKICGSEKKDAVAMETQGKQLSSRACYAMHVRYGQRQLLRQLIGVCK